VVVAVVVGATWRAAKPSTFVKFRIDRLLVAAFRPPAVLIVATTTF
jgi:hypothetical protein